MQKFSMKSAGRRIRSFPLGTILFLAFGVVIVAAMFPLFKSLLTMLKGLAGGLNHAGSELTDALGLNKKSDDEAKAAVLPYESNPWSPKYAQQRGHSDVWTFEEYDKLFEGYRQRVHKAQSWSWGVEMDQYIDLFNDFRSKYEFSLFCWYWEMKEGTNLAKWMQSGWAFGLISSMGDDDFKILNDMVKALPE